MVDYSKLKVEDIKQMLVNEEMFTEEQIKEMDNIKGKSQWVNLHKMLHESNEDTNEKFVFEEPEIKENKTDLSEPMVSTPGYYSIEWQDHVMSQFDEKELVTDKNNKNKKYPTVGGLRRVAELLLGDIVQCGPIDLKTTMDPSIPGKAVITYQIAIAWKLGMWNDLSDNQEFPIKYFTAIGSSWTGNTDDTYAAFPEAIAETRAEGRALRRALRLNVVCADELTNKDTAAITRNAVEKYNEKSTDGDWEATSFITDNQANTIKLLCSRLNIDVNKFINSGSKTYNDINEISRQSAAGMIRKLNEYLSSNNDTVSVPVELLIGGK